MICRNDSQSPKIPEAEEQLQCRASVSGLGRVSETPSRFADKLYEIYRNCEYCETCLGVRFILAQRIYPCAHTTDSKK